ncbi:MAG TPA: zinc-binding dehydrogenase [candidate division Zixibacteria bacterium]|nr:zinc-binding dehydrogenase [candidate division Zixibacteria bacterium]
MNAVRIHEYGDAGRLRYERAPDPEVRSEEDVVVRLRAASLNPFDLRVCRGAFGPGVTLPLIPGADGAGIVVATGPRAGGIRVGDPVCLYPASGCGCCEFCAAEREHLCPGLHMLGRDENGTFAEYVRAPARNCFRLPQGLSFEEGAALPLAYATAWRMLVADAGLKPGESVLVAAVDGGLAAAAVQLARHLGARVFVASRSPAVRRHAEEAGAEHAIDEEAGDVPAVVRELTGKRGVDVAVDCAGGESWRRSLASLAKGGRLVTCGAAEPSPRTDLRRVFWNHLTVSGSALGSRGDFCRALAFLEATGARPPIAERYALKEAARARSRLEAGDLWGKIVLTVVH